MNLQIQWGTMAVRLYELSRKYTISVKELIEIFKKLGYTFKSHLALVSDEALSQFEDTYQKKLVRKKSEVHEGSRQEQVSPEKASSSKVNQKKSDTSHAQPNSLQRMRVKESVRGRAQRGEVELDKPRDMSIDLELLSPDDLARISGKPVNEVILLLLKQGIVATKNQLLNLEQVQKAAELLGLTIRQKNQQITSGEPALSQAIEQQGEWQDRVPIVCVIGHVDHGKTTLLDVIRETRVAAREKGGITQHLGAYEVSTKFGNIVFLDTPGHEAFSLIRVRGVKIADIAILVIAADDGVMPQTIEAINHAQAAGVSLMVAINKIDKVSPDRIDAVKKQLAQYNVIAEEWGGTAVMVPISAKEKTNIDELLDVLVLQAQMMELKANISIAPQCFVLESHLQKGRGPVGTVICRHGVLKVGDYFVSGNVWGRVSSLTNMFSELVDSVKPSIPVQVAGFSSLPSAGELFEVVPKNRVKKVIAARESQVRTRRSQITEGAVLPLVIKASNVSSKEAVVGSIDKIASVAGVYFSLVHSGVGDVTEGDILLASQTNAIIYGLHVKTESNAYALMKKQNVVIKHFDIIYKLLEDIEAAAEAARPIEMELTQTGEAEVIRVFNIKKVGVIAGSIVKSGKCARNNYVEIYRDGEKIGTGTVDGLQREKLAVKEVLAGYECGFLVKGFTDWKLNDRVVCYEKVRKS